MADSIGEPSPFVDLAVGPGEPDNSRFGELLERLRLETGLSRADAAAKLGLSPEYLRLIEVGKRTPALGQMRNLLVRLRRAKVTSKGSRLRGYRQDLLVFDPLDGENGDPVIVEFTSRIAKHDERHSGVPPTRMRVGNGATYERPVESRAAEVGLVVSLLIRADDNTLRKVRKLLEDKVG